MDCSGLLHSFGISRGNCRYYTIRMHSAYPALYKYMGGRHSSVNVLVIQYQPREGESVNTPISFLGPFHAHSVVRAHVFGVFFQQHALKSMGCSTHDKHSKVAHGAFWQIAICTIFTACFLHFFCT